MINGFPFFKQLDMTDCGPACLRMIAKYYGNTYSAEYMREITHITREGVNVAGISDAAEEIGMRSMAATISFETLLDEAPLPCIAHWRQRHFVVVYEFEKGKIIIGDPAHGIIKYTRSEFEKGWLGNKHIQNEN